MLSILGIVAIVVFAIQVYKTANGTERNGALWAAITVVIGIAFQLVIPIFIGMAMGVYLLLTGTAPEDLESAIGGWAFVIGIVCFILSIVGMWLVAKHVSRVPDIPAGSVKPPPPPTF